ncbi:MAG: polysaccharide pyruvyl transferase CsaB [Eubacteriales bacterium]|jgi:polysaccharide pyruvyl transferase CsaB
MKPHKILMVTMSMGVGGAETHILELSKELKRRGHDVALCSHGGVYVDELTAAGIRHYQAPLHTRSLSTMVRSFAALDKVIRKERPDLVHAHARIPALLCHWLCRLHGIPFLTTAHYNFKTTGLLRHFTRWGQRTIAVSQDLKHYLMDSYHLPAANISVTVNGIATDKFSPQASDGGLREELGLPADCRTVCTVSRMDANACKAAEILIDGAEAPCRRDPKLYVLIVGSGGRLEELKARAEAVNAAVGRKCVILTGGRTDVARFTALCDVFVGVSRSALEAMACGKPTILAGNQGYLGLYTRSVLPQCIATNFTCRGIPYPDEGLVWQEVEKLLAGVTPEGLTMEEIRRQSRDIILESYSVERMAMDAEQVYDDLLTNGPHPRFDFVVTGYYGHNNSGDEALLSAVVHNLQKACPQARICALTSAPIDAQNHWNVTAVQRFNLLAVNRVFRHSRVLLFGGGNLIQDITSNRSLLYYLFLLKSAQRSGLRTMLYANGIGPVVKESNRRRAARVLDKCDLITLRDQDSAALLQQMGVTHPRILVTADEILTLTPPSDAQCQAVRHDCGLDGKAFLVVSVRQSRRTPADFFPRLAQAISQVCRQQALTPVLIPMHPDVDLTPTQEFAKLLSVPAVLPQLSSIQDVMCLIRSSQLVVGMRMHALVFAACCQIPFVGLDYDPKVESFVRRFPEMPCYPLEQLDVKALTTRLEEMLAGQDQLRESIGTELEHCRAEAAQNAQLARQLWEDCHENSGN